MAHFYKITFAELKISPPTFPVFLEIEKPEDLRDTLIDYVAQGNFAELDYESEEITKEQYEDEN
jgi:hypothetical protein